MSTVQTQGLDGTIINNQYSKNQKQPLLLFGSFWQYNFPKSFDWDDFCPFLEKEIEDAKKSPKIRKILIKFSNSLKSNVKKFIFSILFASHCLNSKNLIFSSQLRAEATPPRSKAATGGSTSSRRSGSTTGELSQKTTTLFFLNKSHYDIDTQKKEIWTWYQQSTHIGRLGQTKITKEQGKVDPCRPPPRPLSAASLTAVCRTTHRSVAAARSATHGCRWWRPGGKEIVKDLDGYDENLREMDLFEQRMEKAKVSKELQKS